MANMTTQEILQGIKDWAAPKVIYDISAAHNNTKYADLSDALGTNGGNIPQEYRKGGITVRYVRTSDNKYVQYRLMADSWSVDTNDWAFCGDSVYVENPEWIYVLLDSQKRILAGLKSDGSVEWSIGVPTPVKTYIDNAINEIKNGTEGTDLDGLNKIIAFLSELSTSDTLKDLLDTKVDKEEGKSLIPTQYIQEVENPEFVGVLLDSENRIILGAKLDGTIYFGAGCPQQIIDYVKEYVESKINESEEDIRTFLGGLLSTDTTLLSYLNEAYGEYIENPEFMEVELDADDKVLSGRKVDGTKFENMPIETPSVIIKGFSTKITNDKIIVLIDGRNKILSYRDITGKLHESLPTNQDDILQEQINVLNQNSNSIEKSIEKFNAKVSREYTFNGKSSSYLWGEFIKNGNYDALVEREHVRPQAEAANTKINAFIGDDTNCLIFPIITDVHNRISIVEDIINSSKYIQYDFIPTLGDMTIEGNCYNSIIKIEKWAKLFAAAHQGIPPFLSVKGNHDVLCDYDGDTLEYDGSGIFIDDLTFANYFQTPIMRRDDNFHWVYNKSYFYYNIPSKHIRILMLNSSEDNIKNNKYEFYYYTIEQIQWVISTLNNTPDSYDILIMGHRMPCRNDLISRIPPNGTILAQVFSDFNNHTSGNNITYGLNWDFTRKSNKIIAEISGDCHVDAQGTENGVNYIISQGQANWTLNENKSNITFTENFDYTTIMFCDIVCIKPSEQKIKIIKMGWNDDSLDRVLEY